MPDLTVNAVTVNVTLTLTTAEVARLLTPERVAELLLGEAAAPAPPETVREARGRALPAPAAADEKPPKPTHCELATCGRKLKQNKTGRAKRFCDASCAKAARDAAGDDEEHGAPPQAPKLVPPPLPTWRPRQVETDVLPPRPAQDVPPKLIAQEAPAEKPEPKKKEPKATGKAKTGKKKVKAA